MTDGVHCFNKQVCGYFNDEGLARLAFSSWYQLSSSGSEGELQLDAKLRLLKENFTKFEKSLRDSKVKHLEYFLKNNGLQHPLAHREVATAVCSYLLFLASCHRDPVIVNSACNTLNYHIENGVVFAPDRSQILAIALNMGMEKDFLSPDFSEAELPPYVRQKGIPNSKPRTEYPKPFHVKQVVSCLTELLQYGHGWTDAARDALFDVLVAMLVDPYMADILMTPHVTICMDRLVNTYETGVWLVHQNSAKSKMLDLVERLGDLPRAARLPVLSGLPRRGRGLTLRRHAAYFYLQLAISEQQQSDSAMSEAHTFDLAPVVTVADVLVALQGERNLPPATFSSATNDDLEDFFLVLSCVDAAVGSERLPKAQQGQLRQLMTLMQKQVDKVKDHNDHTCSLRIRLKELMAVLNSKWTCMSQDSVVDSTLTS